MLKVLKRDFLPTILKEQPMTDNQKSQELGPERLNHKLGAENGETDI